MLRALVIIGLWLAVGFIRAPATVRDWFSHQHGSGATVVNVATEFAVPAIPPLWLVNVGGDVIEAGGTSPVYRSHMLVLVEPISGIVLSVGQG